MYLDYSPINGFDHEACLDTCFSNEDDAVVKVIEHKIGEFELEELKREVGICENDVNYNRVINGYGTGLRPPTESEWASISEEAFLVEEILWIDQIASPPLEVDHTTTLWFPPIGSQGGEGSCTTWAVGYYMKTFQEAKEHGWDLSGAVWEGGYSGYPSAAYQDKIFSPDFIYHQINDGVDDGSSFEDAMNLVCLIGACSWQKMPYDDSDSVTWPSEEAWREAPLYRGNSSGFEYLIPNTDAKIESVKNWVASDHLAAIAVDADQYLNLTSNDVWTLDNYVNPDENHANTIVGYDDGLNYTEKGELRQGAFKIANSWGVGGWENVTDGCYWISYEAMKQRIDRVMFYRDRIDYEPKLVASFRIDHAERDDCYITLGIGDKSAPIQTKEFYKNYDGGPIPFCSNDIVFDITEFADSVSTVSGQQFFLKVFELGDFYTTGTILDFSIEYYENYSSSVPQIVAMSDDPPVDTATNNYVYAEVALVSSITIEHPSEGQYVNDTVSITGSAIPYQKEEVYAQDFNLEGSMPSDWTTYSEGPNASSWTVELRTNCKKDYWANCSSYKAGYGTNITEWLYMTDGFNASNYSSLDLEFYSYYHSYDGDEYAQVLYANSTSYPTFYVLETWSLPTHYSYGEQHHHINLSAAAGDPEVHLAFIYHGTYDWDVQVDNIIVYGLKTLDEVAVKIGDGNWNIATGTTSWSHNWDTNAYPDGNHTITARAHYGTSYTETSINVFVCNNLIRIDEFFVSDNRCNVSSMQTVGCHAVYAKNGSSLTEGTIWVNDTGYPINGIGWCTFDVTSSNVEKNTWAVTDVSCNGTQYYEVTVPNPYIIFDKVNIILIVNNSRIDAGSEAPINWTGVYAYNGAAFPGSITLNDSLTKNQVGKYGFTTASILDPTYGITAFDSNEVYCIWDRIKISDGGVTHSSTNITQEEIVWFRIEYEYDGIPFSGEVYINDTLATYLALQDSWEYNYTLFSPGAATFTVSQIVDELYELTSVNDAVGPLSITWHHFQIIHDGETYVIPMMTNSRISNLQFSLLLKQIMFNVTGETGTMGYCNITIPKNLLKAEPLSAWIVLLNGYPKPCTTTENETHTFIYMSYVYSNHGIQIQGTWVIAEFPQIMILLLLMVSTMLIGVFNKYAKKTSPRHQPS